MGDHDPVPAWRLIAGFVLIPIAFAAAVGVWWLMGWRGEAAALVMGMTGYGLAALAVWLLWDPDAPAQLRLGARRVRGTSGQGMPQEQARDPDVL